MHYRCFVTVVVSAILLTGEAGAQANCRTPSNGPGSCGPITACTELLQLLRHIRAGLAPPNSISTLRQSVCQATGAQINLCCPVRRSISGGDLIFPGISSGSGSSFGTGSSSGFSTGTVSGSGSSSSTVSGTTSTFGSGSGSGVSLLPSQCGVRGLTDRIIDGEDAPLGAWPWMVIFAGINSLGGRVWFCGGVLISERYVLSAAHCFKPSSVRLDFVRIGEHVLSRNPDCHSGICAPPPQDIRVQQIIQHPQYNRQCKECNDIALVRLASPVRLDSRFAVPICLPIDPLQQMGFSEREYEGKAAWAAGWGSTARDPSVSRQPDVLQQVQLPIHELNFCRVLQQRYPDGRMVLCAGGEGRDTCRGDSGGPLTLSNQFDTQRFVVGVTSLGPTVCGATNTQGLYTNVHYYINWILSTMRP